MTLLRVFLLARLSRLAIKMVLNDFARRVVEDQMRSRS